MAFFPDPNSTAVPNNTPTQPQFMSKPPLASAETQQRLDQSLSGLVGKTTKSKLAEPQPNRVVGFETPKERQEPNATKVDMQSWRSSNNNNEIDLDD